MRDINIVELLQAGAHYGHKSSRWNPKMKPYIYGHRNNIHIFDLEKTKEKLKDAVGYAASVVSKGGSVLFVGTKKQAKQAVKEAAESCGMPYVTERWLGGTFTNYRTIQRSMKKYEKLKALQDSPELEAYTKKEKLLMQREMDKLKRLFSGMEGTKGLPEAIFVFSAHEDRIAIHEANRMKIPVVAIIDTNTDPSGVDYIVPGNDDSVQAISLYARLLADAINEAKKAMPAIEVATPAPKQKAGAAPQA